MMRMSTLSQTCCLHAGIQQVMEDVLPLEQSSGSIEADWAAFRRPIHAALPLEQSSGSIEASLVLVVLLLRLILPLEQSSGSIEADDGDECGGAIQHPSARAIERLH
jgi:hypothetical protein